MKVVSLTNHVPLAKRVPHKVSGSTATEVMNWENELCIQGIKWKTHSLIGDVENNLSPEI